MILNPKLSNFYIQFPKGFFSKKITDKYIKYINKQDIPFDNVEQYINHTIQSINIPGMNIDTVEQIRQFGKKITYKSSTPVQDLFNKDFNITFRLVDGFINYFIILDSILNFLNFANDELFTTDIPVRILDNEGNVILSVLFKDVLITGISSLDLNYTNNNNMMSENFSLSFRYNYINMKLEIDI